METQTETADGECKRCDGQGEVCCACRKSYVDCVCNADGTMPDLMACPACAFRKGED